MKHSNAAPDPTEATPEPTRDEALPPLIRALLRPDAYSHPADDLRLHETHISWVILAGPCAYKVKKPVDYMVKKPVDLGFLDFDTVERRAADSAEEGRLNRRLCPDVYLGVVRPLAGAGLRDGWGHASSWLQLVDFLLPAPAPSRAGKW
jgi:aminoglycoside phosphotransferase family enzyme